MNNIDKKTGIWSLNIAKKRHKCDLNLVKAVIDLFDPTSILDVGCGSGLYCKAFKENGVPMVHGYEGTQNVTSLGVYDEIIEIDLTKPIGQINRFYDLVLCLEVGEHVPKEYEQIFINNLYSMTSQYLILSWADIKQYSASGHVNSRSQKYIINELINRGLEYLKEYSVELRKLVSFSWFKKNLMVFAK